MTISFGSGQTNGLPLLVTAVTQGTRQLLHTFPAGAATPDIVDVFAQNLGTSPRTINVALEDSGGTIIRTFTVSVGPNTGLVPVFSPANLNAAEAALICNGAATLKVWADAASQVAVYARVDNQSNVAGTVAQNLASGLVAAVQNASRFAVDALGGTGQATRANGEIMIAHAGVLRNLRAKVDVAVSGGATLTVSVFINGVASALSVSIANAQGTNLQSDTDSVAVAVGDLVTFSVACDNAGAPAANVQAACEYVAQ